MCSQKAFDGRLYAVVLGVCLMVLPNLVSAIDRQDFDIEYTNDWIFENYADSIRERGALLFGANHYGATYSVVTMSAGMKRLYLSHSKAVSESPHKSIIDSILMESGEIILPGGMDSKGVVFDSALTSYLVEIGATSLDRRIPRAVPCNPEEIIDLDDGTTVYIDLSEHYQVFFPETLDVDSVKSGFEAILPSDCYVEYKPIVIDFDEGTPPEECYADYFDRRTGEQWYLYPDSGINAFAAWEVVCPFFNNKATGVFLDHDYGTDSLCHPDILDNVSPRSQTTCDQALSHLEHGTNVAGVFGAVAGNNFYSNSSALDKVRNTPVTHGEGIVGAAPNSDMILLNYFDGTDYVADLKYVLDSCLPVDVVNMSWGIFIADPALRDLMLIGYQKYNITFVAAAGNNIEDRYEAPYLIWPASFYTNHEDFVIGVTFSDTTKRPASNANWGEHVDIMAPGVDILTTGPVNHLSDETWSYHSGSSYAAPLISATVTNMRTILEFPTPTLWDILKVSCDPKPEPYVSGEWDPHTGYGKINMELAVRGMLNRFCDTVPGDINADCSVNFTDIFSLMDLIYFGDDTLWVPLDMADVNADCDVNLLDILYMISYLFRDGPAPQAGCAGKCTVDSKQESDGITVAQNYPNPFNPTTTFQFTLSEASDYSVRIYNVVGQMVDEIKGQSGPGTVSVTWDAGNLASGMYFYKIQAGKFSETKKMVILK
ncbi:MAG: T9SS type A sorting domain-containing protein [candidate division Zixibacteria bacterium]|nr:T9SS type A sorting domain-containing protein [candidate division Zixibacteria bacterium]